MDAVNKNYFCNEIAEMLKIVNMTNDRPNRRLIKLVADRLKLVPSECVHGEIINPNPNGKWSGLHSYVKKKYDMKSIDIINNDIRKRMKSLGNNTYSIYGIKFRISEGVDK